MFELISIISIALAIAALSSARGMRTRFEGELAAIKIELKRLDAMRLADTGEMPTDAEASVAGTAELAAEAASEAAAEDVPAQPQEPVAAIDASTEDATPWDAEPAKPAAASRPSWESRIAAQWTVWVGGIALAFAGIFAIRYSIEQGFFSPAVRLSAAAVFGVVLIAVGEFLRRQARPVVQSAFQNAMIPGVLTAAGTLTLFGAVYVAHGFYGYFGPATAFILLALISFMTLGLSMLYGQALAGLGLLASFTTPMLVASSNPSPWPLFGFLSLVWIATTLASKIQRWNIVQALANAGLSIWVLVYLGIGNPFAVMPALLPMLVMIAGLAFIWPGDWQAAARPESAEDEVRLDSAGRPIQAREKSPWEDLLLPRHAITTLVLAVFSLMIAVAFVAPDLDGGGNGHWGYVGLVVALALFGAYRTYAIYAAIGASIAALGGIRAMLTAGASQGFQPAEQVYLDPNLIIWLALGLGLFLALLALAVVSRRRDSHPEFSRVWIILGGLTPLMLATLSFFFFGNYAFDITHGLYAILLGLLYLGAAQVFYGHAENDGRFVVNRDLLVAASWAAFIYALLVMTNGIATTIGVAILGFVYLNGERIRNWPVLPWAMVASAIFVAGRIAWEPTIVGASNLSTTPVFNQLLAGYGIPAALLIASAWLIRNSDDDRIRNVLQALASLFTLLTIAILVRHAMNKGVLTSDFPTLAEQSIYTLLTIGASVTLMALDLRRPSIIFRFGSMALGYLSMASILLAHFVGLNPYFTWESTGAIPFFNLLFLAYLLPGIAYAGAAWVARGRRPQHYVIALALASAALLFAYVTLSVRRFYHGADISDWKGFLQSELYTYSVVWLLLGVALLVAGYRFRSTALRIASGVLVLIAVLKVFLIDMANLEGLYRALSFAGLGVALIGIGWFYQRALLGLAKEEKPEETAVSET